MNGKDEYDAWAAALANDARVRDYWLRQFKAEGYRIVKLKQYGQAATYTDPEYGGTSPDFLHLDERRVPHLTDHRPVYEVTEEL